MMNLRLLNQLPDETHRVLRTAMIIISAWDAEVFGHCEQVARDLLSFAPEGEEEEWYWAGLLHDIGKITIPQEILSKPGSLNEAERKIVQQHPIRGTQILESIGAPKAIVEAAQFHHERWDGAGYPSRISGENTSAVRERQIPMIARVLAVADVYAALTSDRPYRSAFTPAQARLEIERNAGTQFEPEVVARFFERKNNAS
jgi:putative nucleotidyltransferase with HDIG domain